MGLRRNQILITVTQPLYVVNFKNEEEKELALKSIEHSKFASLEDLLSIGTKFDFTLKKVNIKLYFLITGTNPETGKPYQPFIIETTTPDRLHLLPGQCPKEINKDRVITLMKRGIRLCDAYRPSFGWMTQREFKAFKVVNASVYGISPNMTEKE